MSVLVPIDLSHPSRGAVAFAEMLALAAPRTRPAGPSDALGPAAPGGAEEGGVGEEARRRAEEEEEVCKT